MKRYLLLAALVTLFLVASAVTSDQQERDLDNIDEEEALDVNVNDDEDEFDEDDDYDDEDDEVEQSSFLRMLQFNGRLSLTTTLEPHALCDGKMKSGCKKKGGV